jgi:hypothetical protein
MPVFELQSGNEMAFHPRYWDTPVKNSSSGYNYYEWNQKYRGTHVATYTSKDPRPLPAATVELEIEPALRIICPVGGLILFQRRLA